MKLASHFLTGISLASIGFALSATSAGAQESATLIDTIAQANRSQSSALEEVTIAVRQMDEMTQHNAALVEETNAAIEQTDDQVNELDKIVDVFRVDGHSRGSETSAVRRPKTAARGFGSAALTKRAG